MAPQTPAEMGTSLLTGDEKHRSSGNCFSHGAKRRLIFFSRCHAFGRLVERGSDPKISLIKSNYYADNRGKSIDSCEREMN